MYDDEQVFAEVNRQLSAGHIRNCPIYAGLLTMRQINVLFECLSIFNAGIHNVGKSYRKGLKELVKTALIAFHFNRGIEIKSSSQGSPVAKSHV